MVEDLRLKKETTTRTIIIEKRKTTALIEIKVTIFESGDGPVEYTGPCAIGFGTNKMGVDSNPRELGRHQLRQFRVDFLNNQSLFQWNGRKRAYRHLKKEQRCLWQPRDLDYWRWRNLSYWVGSTI